MSKMHSLTDIIAKKEINKIKDADGAGELEANIQDKSLYFSECKAIRGIPEKKHLPSIWKRLGKAISYGKIRMVPAEHHDEMLGAVAYVLQYENGTEELKTFVASFDELDAFMQLYEEIKTRE